MPALVWLSPCELPSGSPSAESTAAVADVIHPAGQTSISQSS